jgi:ADP-ribose pyrophosphatase
MQPCAGGRAALGKVAQGDREPVGAQKGGRMGQDGGWVRNSSQYLFESQWYALRQDRLTLPDGRDITYTLVEHPGYVMVAPLLADGRVVMERIFRHTLERTQLECPSGGMDGDLPEVAARRELEEETGYLAGKLEPLGRFSGSAGISDEEFYIYLATELRCEGRLQREPTEQIELELIPLTKLRERVLHGQIQDGPTALAILLASHAVGLSDFHA